MALARRGGADRRIDYWPGFVPGVVRNLQAARQMVQAPHGWSAPSKRCGATLRRKSRA